jgi:hypothetical protein
MFQGYLAMGGTELINNERSRGYVQTTGCPLWWFKGPACDTLADYLGVDPDHQEGASFTADQITTAPWFDPAQPELSTRFYGAFAITFKGFLDSTRTAQVTENVTDGGRIGLTRRNTRSVTVQALLTADGQDALDYGVAWLSAALDPGSCGQHGDTCGTSDLTFLADCPPPRQDISTPGPWTLAQSNWAVGSGAATTLPPGWSASLPDDKTIRLTASAPASDPEDIATVNLNSVEAPSAETALPVSFTEEVFVGLRWRSNSTRQAQVTYTWYTAGEVSGTDIVTLTGVPDGDGWISRYDGLPVPEGADGLTLAGTGAGSYAAGDWVELTDLLVTKQAPVDGFFDGDTVPENPDTQEYAWDGDPNASTSRYETRQYVSSPEDWDTYEQRTTEGYLRYLHDCACVSGPLVTDELQGPGQWCGLMVEFTVVSERPWVFQATRTPVLPSTSSTVVQDVPYNLVPYPSAEIRSDTQAVVATNYITNPSIEVNATGWASSVVDQSGSAAAMVTSGQSTDTAIVGTHSFRVRLLGTASGVTNFYGSGPTITLASLPGGARPNLNLWVANLLTAGGIGSGRVEAQAVWRDSGGTVIRTDTLGVVPTNSSSPFTARSQVPPAGAASVQLRAAALNVSYASGTDFKIYADAAAVTVP